MKKGKISGCNGLMYLVCPIAGVNRRGIYRMGRRAFPGRKGLTPPGQAPARVGSPAGTGYGASRSDRDRGSSAGWRAREHCKAPASRYEGVGADGRQAGRLTGRRHPRQQKAAEEGEFYHDRHHHPDHQLITITTTHPSLSPLPPSSL